MDGKRHPKLETSRSSSSRHSSCSLGCREGFLKIPCQSLWDAEKRHRFDDATAVDGLEGLLLVSPVSLMFDPILMSHQMKDEKTDDGRSKETDKSHEALTVHLDMIGTMALYMKHEELDKKKQILDVQKRTQTLGSTVIQGTQSIGNTVIKGTQNIGNTVRQENLGESFIQAVGRTLSSNARKIPKNLLNAQQTLDEFFEQKEFAATKFEQMQEKRSKRRAALVEHLICRTNEIRMKAQSSDAFFLENKSLKRNKSPEKSPQNSDFDEYCSTDSFLLNNLTLTDSSNNIFYLYIKVNVCEQRNSFSSSTDEAFEQDEKQQQREEQIEMSIAKNKQKPRRSLSESYGKIKEYLFRSRDSSISRDLFSFLAQYWPKRSSSTASMTVVDSSDKNFCSSTSDGSMSNEANDAASLIPSVSNLSSAPKNKNLPDHYLQEYAIIVDEKILKNRRPFFRRTNSENLPFAADFEVIFDEEVGRLCEKKWEISTIGDILEQLRFAEMQAFDDETGYLPLGAEQSKILTEDMIRQLSLHLPARAQGYSWILAYSTEQHGFGLSTLYRNMSLFNDLSPTLLVIRDKNQKIFGAIVSCPLKLSDAFYGSGESLLFTFVTADDQIGAAAVSASSPFQTNPKLTIFHWTGCNRFVAKGDKDGLALGSGQGSFGIFLDDDLNRGRTRHCETFNNRPLTDENFFVADLEAFVFGIDE
uniref:Oxidation resistance protein 1 n=1 Tax=Romanomermis culicivorax TaxID=13658 RepID=A0A915JZJ3_ROMCU